MDRTRRRNIIYKVLLVILISPSIYGFIPTAYHNIFSNTRKVSIIQKERNVESFLSPAIRVRDISVNQISSHTPSTIIGYDVATKSVKVEDAQSYKPTSMLQDNHVLTYPFPPDDRVKITTTSTYPWSTICKLYITAADDTQYIGSGAIIDEYHILTCGHCVYISENGGWISELKVIPGMDGSYEPFGHAFATYFRSYTGWTQDEMFEHDWAVVTLDRNIGNYTGWMGRRTADPSEPIYTGTLHIAGYPGDLGNGNFMYYDSDVGENADEFNHWYWMDSAPGQSGGPVWLEDAGDPYILSINAYEYEDGAYANAGTRLNTDKFNQINTWLAEDSAPTDGPDLTSRDTFTNISTTIIKTSNTLFSIYCDVMNSGTSIASSFNVSFHASHDLTLDINDYLIGTTLINYLDPFDFTAADWSGVFPSFIPDGFYYIGWKFDANNQVLEINEDNNSFVDEYLLIRVQRDGVPVFFMTFLIPIIIIIVVVAVILALVFALRRRKVVEAPLLELPEEEFSIYDNQRGSQDQIPLSYCTNCGNPIMRETQKFCTNCGFNLDNKISENHD